MTDQRRDSFSRLFVLCSAGLKRYVRRFVHSREIAEEIAQEAFLRAYKHAEDNRPARALLYAIARNLALDHYRHERTAQTQPLGEIPPSTVFIEGESLESWILAQERSALLRDAIERLPPQCRAAFALKIFRGLDYQEIAQTLGVSRKTVEGHVSRGIRETYRYLRMRYQLKDVGTHSG